MNSIRTMAGRLKQRLEMRALERRTPGASLAGTAYIDERSSIGSGITVDAGCIVNSSRLASGVSLEGGCVLTQATLGEGSRIRTDCYVNASTLGAGVTVGAKSRVSECHLDGPAAIGSGCSLSMAKIGAYSYIADGCVLSRTDIGRFCSVGPGLISGPGDHPTDLLTTCPAFYSTAAQNGRTFAEADFFEEVSQVRIGNDVWLGARVTIRSGVIVGDGAIVGAGAVVVDNVPPYAIVGGVPAKLIRMRFDAEAVDALLALGWWDWQEPRLQRAAPVLRGKDVQALIDWARDDAASEGAR